MSFYSLHDYQKAYSDPFAFAARHELANVCFLRFFSGGNKNYSSTTNEITNPAFNTSPAQEVAAGGSASNVATPTLVDEFNADVGIQQNTNIQAVTPGFDALLQSASSLFDNTYRAIDGQLSIFNNAQTNSYQLLKEQADTQAAERIALADERRLANTSQGTRDIATLIKESIVPIAIGAVVIAVTGKKFW